MLSVCRRLVVGCCRVLVVGCCCLLSCVRWSLFRVWFSESIAVCCMLTGVCCFVCGVCCMVMLVDGCCSCFSLLPVVCIMLLFAVRRLLFVVCSSVLAVRCLLFVVACLLCVMRCLLFVGCGASLRVVCCVLFVVCCRRFGVFFVWCWVLFDVCLVLCAFRNAHLLFVVCCALRVVCC